MAKTILIIEDDKDILDMMMYVLQDEGFQVVTSQEGVSRDYLLRHDPALILLDDRLAAGFGRDLCMKIKKDPATRRCCRPDRRQRAGPDRITAADRQSRRRRPA